MSRVTIAQPDITLKLDLEGVIRGASLAESILGGPLQDWVGRPWTETVEAAGSDHVRRMLEDARAVGVSAFRQVTQRFPSGLQLPVEYTTVRLGGTAGLVAVGKNLQAVVEQESRLLEAQQASEQVSWKLRGIETRSRLLFDTSSEPVLVVRGTTLQVLEANPAAIRALGVVPGAGLPAELAAGETEAVAALLERARAAGRAPGIVVHLGPGAEPWMLRAAAMSTGPEAAFLLRLAPLEEGRGEPSIALPVDDLLERLPEGFAITDAAGTVLRANRAFLDLAQLATEALATGQPIGRWLGRPGADFAGLAAAIRQHGAARRFATVMTGELGTETAVAVAAIGRPAIAPRLFALLLRDAGQRDPVEEGAAMRAAVEAFAGELGRTPLPQLVRQTAALVERHLIDEALRRAQGKRIAAAELLGLSRQSLYVKLGRYGMDPGDQPEADPEPAA
jgi:transcriptional regulator PpsR